MSTKPPLGRLERVDLRTAWQNEAQDFTPWLGRPENIKELAETLGIELEVASTEERVGPFRADILCRDTVNDTVVLIENQLGRTDHLHLGQILTYASGLDAVTIIWIAAKFTEEHRSAIDWLNRISAEQFSFFAVEVELWRIGGSDMAPKFNIVAKPNDWTRSVREAATDVSHGDPATVTLRHEFWEGLQRALHDKGSRLRIPEGRVRAFARVNFGRAGYVLGARFSVQRKDVAACLFVQTRRAEDHYRVIVSQRAEIERELGFALDWTEREGTHRRRIETRLEVDVTDRTQWPRLQAWLAERLTAMDAVIRPRLPPLKMTDDEEDDGE